MRKRTSGLIIRLVDIVFIILFGFIAITQVSSKLIDLPRAKNTSEEAPEPKNIDITIEPAPLGPGVVVEIKERNNVHKQLRLTTIGWTSEQERTVYDNERRLLLDNIDRFASVGEMDSVRVQIRPDKGTAVQFTIDVWDACRELNLPHAIVVTKTAEEKKD